MASRIRSQARAGLARLSSLAGSGFGPGGLALVLAITGLNLSNFVFHTVISRIVGPSQYGELSALLNVVVVLAIPIGALQAAVAQVVAESGRSPGRAGARRLLTGAVAASLFVAAAWLGAVAPVDGLLRVHSPLPAASLAVWIVLTVAGSVLQGVLIGQRRFAPVAWSQLVGGGLIRLISAVVLVEAGAGVTGAVLATPISALGSLAILGWACRSDLGPGGSLHVTSADAFRSVAGLGGATLLTSLDAWLARHYLAATPAGYFASAATAGRISLFLPGAISTVLFPALARASGDVRRARQELRRAASVVSAVTLVTAAGLAAFSSLVVSILFGTQFAAAASVLPIVAFADAGIALVTLLVYFFLTRRSRWALASWVACALALALGGAFHGSARTLAYDMLATNLGTTAVLAAAAAVHLRRAAPSPARAAFAKPAAPAGSDSGQATIAAAIEGGGA